MGVVSRQATLATIFSYVGVLIGFLNVAILMNRWFSTEEFGLRSILLDFAVLYSQIAHLGTYRSLVKFFPLFNKNGKSDSGLLSIGLIVPFFGFLLFGILIFLFQPLIVETYSAKSPLFLDYFIWAFPLAFLLMYNNVFESYLQSRAKTAYSVFLKSVFNRIVVSGLLFLFYLKWIDFNGFIQLFVFSYALNILLFIIYLINRKEFSLKLNPNFFRKRLRRVYFNYSFYSILSGASSVIVNKIDSLMLGSFLGLAFTAVYSNAVYLSILLAIPADAISKISFPLVSRSWKNRNIKEIEVLYKKTSTTQFLIGGFLFALLWSNIDSFYLLQKEEYAAGKNVLLILGFARLVNMMFGINGQIINVSKHYRFDTITSIALAITTVITNLIFIPIWGIEGAAFATALSIVLFNLSRFFYVSKKLNIQPFDSSTLKVFLIIAVAFFIGYFVPDISYPIIDVVIRSILISVFVGLTTYYWEISEDINAYIENALKKFTKRA